MRTIEKADALSFSLPDPAHCWSRLSPARFFRSCSLTESLEQARNFDNLHMFLILSILISKKRKVCNCHELSSWLIATPQGHTRDISSGGEGWGGGAVADSFGLQNQWPCPQNVAIWLYWQCYKVEVTTRYQSRMFAFISVFLSVSISSFKGGWLATQSSSSNTAPRLVEIDLQNILFFCRFKCSF